MWRRFYHAEPELLPRYTGDWSETTGEETLLLAAVRLLERKSSLSTDIGEVLVFRMRNSSVAKHLGLSATLGGVPTFIHAYTGHGVIETPLSDPWLRKIAGRFDFPGGVK